jgi:putative sigma-54 modulation protein
MSTNPRIVEVHGILNIEKYRHTAEVILRCSNHITIKASSESEDMYASIDQVVDRIARKMEKFHTPLMRNGLARRHSVRTGPSEIRGLYY